MTWEHVFSKHAPMKHPHPHQTHIEDDGFTITACRGARGCPHAALQAGEFETAIQKALAPLGIGDRLRQRLGSRLSPHHILNISISYCPNGCSRPQIADIGLIGAATPLIDADSCTACGACSDSCREDAICFDTEDKITGIDAARCVRCGACAMVCPAGAITSGEAGFRVLLGGKLGRHPRFAAELPSLVDEKNAPEFLRSIINTALDLMQDKERLGDLINRLGTAPFETA